MAPKIPSKENKCQRKDRAGHTGGRPALRGWASQHPSNKDAGQQNLQIGKRKNLTNKNKLPKRTAPSCTSHR
jgi:hypothetical protein